MTHASEKGSVPDRTTLLYQARRLSHFVPALAAATRATCIGHRLWLFLALDSNMGYVWSELKETPNSCLYLENAHELQRKMQHEMLYYQKALLQRGNSGCPPSLLRAEECLVHSSRVTINTQTESD